MTPFSTFTTLFPMNIAAFERYVAVLEKFNSKEFVALVRAEREQLLASYGAQCAISPKTLDSPGHPDDTNLAYYRTRLGRHITGFLGSPNMRAKRNAIGTALDGATVITWDRRCGTIFRWDAATGREVHRFAVAACPTAAGAFDNAARRFGMIDDDGTVRLYDAESGALNYTLASRFKLVPRHENRCAFSPNGKMIFSYGPNGQSACWNVETGEQLTPPDADSIISSAFKHDQGGSQEMKKVLALLNEKSVSATTCAAFTPDGQRIITASGDKTLRVSDTETGLTVKALTGPRRAVQWCSVSRDGKRIYSSSTDNTIAVWDLESGTQIKFPELGGFEKNSIFETSDAKRLIVSSGYTFKILDATTGKELQAPEIDQATPTLVVPEGQKVFVTIIEGDRAIEFRDSETGEVKRRADIDPPSPASMAASPDGKYLIASGSGEISVWDVASGTQLKKHKTPEGETHCCAVTSDGKHIGYTVENDFVPGKSLHLVDFETGQKIRSYEVGAAVREIVPVPKKSDQLLLLLETDICMFVQLT